MPSSIALQPGGHADAGREAERPRRSAPRRRPRGPPTPITWRRPAPMARISAISLVRWATRIENEL